MITENYDTVYSSTVKNRLTISLLPQFEYRFAGEKEGERNREKLRDASIYAYILIQKINRERSSCRIECPVEDMLIGLHKLIIILIKLVRFLVIR